MTYFLYGLFFISCIVLIGSILLQPGKMDAGALFTSNISSTAFGPRGTQSILSKVTITAATVFMLTALMLSMPALTENLSVLQTTTPTTTPAPGTAQADTITNLNTNTQTNTGATNASETSISNSSANAGANANANK